MSETPEPEMMSTQQLLVRLEELDKKLKLSAENGHKVNGFLHGTLNRLTDKADVASQKIDQQDEVLNQIQLAVQKIDESVNRIQACLVGDDKFNRDGLLKDFLRIQAAQVNFDTQLKLAMDSAKKNAADIAAAKRTAGILLTALAGLGALITWVRNTGFFKFLSNP